MSFKSSSSSLQKSTTAPTSGSKSTPNPISTQISKERTNTSSYPSMTSSKPEKTTAPIITKTEKSPVMTTKSLVSAPKDISPKTSFATSPPKKVSSSEKPHPGLISSSPKRERASSAFMDKSMPAPIETTAPINVMVTGASRGIGQFLVGEFLNNRDIKRVIATTRRSEDATDIKKKFNDSRLIVVLMDVTDDDSIEKAYESASETINVLKFLVNNAGCQILYNAREKPKRIDILRQFDVNSVSPIIVTQMFLPLLLKAAERNPSTELSTNKAAVINISDVAGSIALNNTDTIIQNPLKLAYRMSKTALNSSTRSLSLDLAKDGILFVALCPSQTDMGTQMTELTLDDSMTELVQTIYKLRTKHNGCFIQRDGKPIVF